VRVVLDTNVMVSAALNAAAPPGQIFRALRLGRFDLVTSSQLISELSTVVRRPSLMRRLAWEEADADLFVTGLRRLALEVTATETLDVVARDPDDNRVLEAAIAGEADYIVTGDRDLLDMVVFRGVRIVTPAQFMIMLSSLDA
jgi:putative PIN family toxin of toxin-antitoxin system